MNSTHADGLYGPSLPATIESSNSTPSRCIDASVKSRSVFDRIARRQPRAWASSSAGRTSGKAG